VSPVLPLFSKAVINLRVIRIPIFTKNGTARGAKEEMMKIVSFYFAAMYYIYILLSESSGHYYIGHTDDPERRLNEHNNADEVTFTSKHRPWKEVFRYPVSEKRSEAIIIEKYLKRRKSKTLLNKLIAKQGDNVFLKLFFDKIFYKRGFKQLSG